jgi:hypothetical protein
MDHLSSLIPGVLRKRGLYDDAHAAMIVYRAKKWLQETHPEMALTLCSYSLQNGILSIHAGRSIEQQKEASLESALLSFLQSDDKAMVKEVRISRK